MLIILAHLLINTRWVLMMVVEVDHMPTCSGDSCCNVQIDGAQKFFRKLCTSCNASNSSEQFCGCATSQYIGHQGLSSAGRTEMSDGWCHLTTWEWGSVWWPSSDAKWPYKLCLWLCFSQQKLTLDAHQDVFKPHTIFKMLYLLVGKAKWLEIFIGSLYCSWEESGGGQSTK